mgnify:CR=1 FL=1
MVLASIYVVENQKIVDAMQPVNQPEHAAQIIILTTVIEL